MAFTSLKVSFSFLSVGLCTASIQFLLKGLKEPFEFLSEFRQLEIATKMLNRIGPGSYNTAIFMEAPKLIAPKLTPTWPLKNELCTQDLA